MSLISSVALAYSIGDIKIHDLLPFMSGGSLANQGDEALVILARDIDRSVSLIYSVALADAVKESRRMTYWSPWSVGSLADQGDEALVVLTRNVDRSLGDYPTRRSH